uniref:glycosyltransferase n=1 Tax=Flavobacterium sp. TaxID=239 RepID=UPI004047FCE5
MKNKNSIIVSSGIIDSQLSGNQSFKETIRGLNNFYNVIIIGLIPSDIPNIDYVFTRENSKKTIRPGFLFSLLYKIIRGRHKSKIVRAVDVDVNTKDAISDYGKIIGILVNIVYLIFSLYNSIRLFYYCLLVRPKFIYGYETVGVISAYPSVKILNIPLIKRFQGTSLPINVSSHASFRYFTQKFAIQHLNSRSLTVMANDGTNGNTILNHYKVNNYIFPINGLPDSVINYQKKKIKKNNSRILNFVAVSKLKKWKKVDRTVNYFIGLMQELEKHGYSSELKIIGNGPEFENLCRLIASIEKGEKVHLIGELNHDKVLSAIDQADYLISLYDVSNLGNPVLEASYLNTNIITFQEPALLGVLDPATTIYVKQELTTDFTGMASRIISEKSIDVSISQEIRSWRQRMNYEIEEIEKFIEDV